MTRKDWRGQPLRRGGMTLAKAISLADSMRRTRLARGGKAGEHHYDTHRAMERLAREVRKLRQYAPRKIVFVDSTPMLQALKPTDGPLTSLLFGRRKRK